METIDYRITGWGHNQYFKSQSDGTYYGPCWYVRRINIGDHILWRTNYGHAVAEVIDVRHTSDPDDMYFVRSRIIDRVANPSIVAQEDLDKYFGITRDNHSKVV